MKSKSLLSQVSVHGNQILALFLLSLLVFMTGAFVDNAFTPRITIQKPITIVHDFCSHSTAFEYAKPRDFIFTKPAYNVIMIHNSDEFDKASAFSVIFWGHYYIIEPNKLLDVFNGTALFIAIGNPTYDNTTNDLLSPGLLLALGCQ